MTLKQSILSLPFVGRKEQLDQIVEFHQSISELDKAGVLWISGEAGIGKSRLLEESLTHLGSSKTIILHNRIYPGSSSSISELLSQTIKANLQVNRLLTTPVKSELNSVLLAIRRLARLQPVILIFDDLHLLEEEEARKLSQLIHGLAEDPITILCAARPDESSAYGELIPFLVDTILLRPLNVSDVEVLLQQFDVPVQNSITPNQLHEITHGIPLLIRSVAPDIVKWKDSELSSGNSIKRTLALIQSKSQTSIQAITTAMVADLREEDLETARALATLGEVFGESAAEVVVDQSVQLITQLSEKGILAQPLEVVSELRGSVATERIWKFTHTLLHEHLLLNQPQSSELAERLYDILKLEDVALYTITPFVYLANHRFATDEEEKVESLVAQLIEFCRVLYKKGHRQLSLTLLDQTEQLYERGRAFLSEEARMDIQEIRVYLLFLYPFSTEFRSAVETYLQLTENPSSVAVAIHRVTALCQDIPIHASSFPESLTNRLSVIEKLVQDFPDLLLMPQMIGQMIYMVSQIGVNYSSRVVKQFRKLFQRIMDAAEEHYVCDQQLIDLFTVSMLQLFSTRKESELHNEQVEELLSRRASGDFSPEWFLSIGEYLLMSGQVGKVSELIDAYKTERAGYNFVEDFSIMLYGIHAAAAMGAPWKHISSLLRNQLDVTSPVLQQMASHQSIVPFGIALCAVEIGKMRAEEEAANEFLQELSIQDARVSESQRAGLILKPDPEVLQSLLSENVLREELQELLKSLLSEKPDVLQTLQPFLLRKIAHKSHLFFLRAGIALSQYVGTDEELRPSISYALQEGLQWCCQNNLAGYAWPLLPLAEEYMAVDEYHEWKKRINSLQRRLIEEYGWTETSNEDVTDKPIQVTIIGNVTVTVRGKQPQRIQGARVRQVLALMVANEIQRDRLSADDFREISIGSHLTVQDSANTLRVTVSRIRQLLGKEAVIVERNLAPRLNLDLIEVDVLNVLCQFENAREAARKLKPRKARSLLLKSLELLGTEPVYPTLYTEFFEAARLDFELQFREAILQIAHLLHHEGAYEDEKEVLSVAYNRTPNDDEIAEKLISVLELLGQHVDALRVRKRQDALEIMH